MQAAQAGSSEENAFAEFPRRQVITQRNYRRKLTQPPNLLTYIGKILLLNLFKRFWRSDASRSLPGNGLGLAVVKAIVTSYGGSVTCTSRPGVGTTFVVKL